jgi:hypothetical protein
LLSSDQGLDLDPDTSKKAKKMAAVFRIRIHIGSAFNGRLRNVDPDPGGLKRAKLNVKMQPKDKYLGIKSIKNNVIGTGIQMV